MTKFETLTYRLTNGALISGGAACMLFFILDEVFSIPLGNAASITLDCISTALIVCVFFGWYAAIKYLLSRPTKENTTADWMLLIGAIMLPPSAIYFLRHIRKQTLKSQGGSGRAT